MRVIRFAPEVSRDALGLGPIIADVKHWERGPDKTERGNADSGWHSAAGQPYKPLGGPVPLAETAPLDLLRTWREVTADEADETPAPARLDRKASGVAKAAEPAADSNDKSNVLRPYAQITTTPPMGHPATSVSGVFDWQVDCTTTQALQSALPLSDQAARS